MPCLYPFSRTSEPLLLLKISPLLLGCPFQYLRSWHEDKVVSDNNQKPSGGGMCFFRKEWLAWTPFTVQKSRVLTTSMNAKSSVDNLMSDDSSFAKVKKKVFHSFSFLLHIYKRIMDSTWVILRKFMKITTFFGFRWLTPNNNQTNIVILSYPYERVVGFHGGLQEGHQVLWSHRLYVANVPCPWRPAGGFLEEVGCPFGFIRNPWVSWCLFQKTLDIKCLQYIYI